MSMVSNEGFDEELEDLHLRTLSRQSGHRTPSATTDRSTRLRIPDTIEEGQHVGKDILNLGN